MTGFYDSRMAGNDLSDSFVVNKHSSNMNDSSCYMNDLCLSDLA